MLADLLNQLDAAGIHLEMEGDLIAAPAGVLTDDLRQSIKEHRAELVQWLRAEAANDDKLPDFWTEQTEWRELAARYYAHHACCITCMAAGRGRGGYGERCATGLVLWTAYTESV